jgi:hypothetical protein
VAGHVVRFFATRNDQLALLREITAGRSLGFHLAGVFEVPPETIKGHESIPSLGIAKKGDRAHEDRFLVLPIAEPVQTREVRLSAGGTHVAIDQLVNPTSVMFCAGGEWDGGRTIIAGDVGTVSTDAASKSLWSAFAKPIKKRWARVRAYYVGPEALVILRGGGRLTPSVQMPALYDLAE